MARSMFRRPVIDAIQRHAIEAYPLEACGLVVNGEYERCLNCHEDPTENFRVPKRAMVSAIGRGLQAVVHSHPNGPNRPSAIDMARQIASGVPWGIVCTDGQQATEPIWFGAGAIS